MTKPSINPVEMSSDRHDDIMKSGKMDMPIGYIYCKDVNQTSVYWHKHFRMEVYTVYSIRFSPNRIDGMET